MIIIFEGIDKTGKTTLVERTMSNLVDQGFEFRYFRSKFQGGKPVNLEEAIKHDWRFMLDFLTQTCFDVVFDRSFISQYAYSMALRPQSVLAQFGSSDAYKELMMNYFEMLKANLFMIVLCTRGDFTGASDNFLKFDIDVVNKLNYYFYDILSLAKVNFVTCVFEDGIVHNEQKIIESLKAINLARNDIPWK